MDDSSSVVLAVMITVAVGAMSGLISYANAEDTMQKQAIAAGVACFKVAPDGGRSHFVWNCK